MKADPAIQRKLLDLAEIDAELARIGHRRANLPERAEVIELEQAQQARRDALVSTRTRASDLDTDIAKQEKEIDAVRARESRDRGLLDSGLGAKQQAEVEHELNSLQRRQSALEDDLLELMEQREALSADVDHAEAQLTKAAVAREEAAQRRDAALADLDTTEARRQADRTELVPQLPDDVLADYQRLHDQHGIGAALLRSRKCGACRLELDRTAIARIAATDAGEVVHCDECGAILVRTAESGL